jgi:predicted transcriptional regulator of viral defense system
MSHIGAEQELQTKARFKSGEAFTLAEIASDLRVDVKRARTICNTLKHEGRLEKVGVGTYCRPTLSHWLRRAWV